MDSLEGARKAKADADASLKVSNDLVAAVEAKLQQLQDKFMEVRSTVYVLQSHLCRIRLCTRGSTNRSRSPPCFEGNYVYIGESRLFPCAGICR